MTASTVDPWPATYVIRVGGHLDPHWAESFGLDLNHDTDGTTSLSGVLADQAALHGVLGRIRDLGVPLLSVMSTNPAQH